MDEWEKVIVKRDSTDDESNVEVSRTVLRGITGRNAVAVCAHALPLPNSPFLRLPLPNSPFLRILLLLFGCVSRSFAFKGKPVASMINTLLIADLFVLLSSAFDCYLLPLHTTSSTHS